MDDSTLVAIWTAHATQVGCDLPLLRAVWMAGVAQERERCWAIAEVRRCTDCDGACDDEYCTAATEIAAAIRALSQPGEQRSVRGWTTPEALSAYGQHGGCMWIDSNPGIAYVPVTVTWPAPETSCPTCKEPDKPAACRGCGGDEPRCSCDTPDRQHICSKCEYARVDESDAPCAGCCHNHGMVCRFEAAK